MLQSNGTGGEENPAFKWGVKKRVSRTDKNVHFYESFTFEGIEYKLFDSAYFIVEGQCETSVGKIVRMYQTSKGEKKIKVVWFFRPVDINNFLGAYEPVWDELFLACGDAPGVYNVNDVDTVIGKCNVVCISNDRRNPQPTRNALSRANYVFSRTFDTGLKIISKDFADAIAGVRVESFFNRIRDKLPLKSVDSSPAAIPRGIPVKSFHSELGKDDRRDGKLKGRTSSIKKGFILKDRADHIHLKKSPPVNKNITSRDLKTKTRPLAQLHAAGSSVDPRPSKKRKLILNTPEAYDSDDDSAPQLGEQRIFRISPREEKAPSQNIDKSSWFKKLPFEEELKVALEKERVLLIENLEPSYTSLEVEDLCRRAFKERVEAKMIPLNLWSNSRNGKALVIFGTTKAADNALSRLTKGCLMLSDMGPLVASRNFPKEVGHFRRFTGHLNLVDKALLSTEKKKAVSTSHFSQPNHIVHQMGLQWLALQASSEAKRKKLFEEQAKEINTMMRSKSHQVTRG